MIITVYTTPACSQCRMTKNWLDRESIAYEVVDATADENVAEAIRATAEADGILPNMPYVQVSNGNPENDLHWFGFQPDNLSKYTTTEAA